MSAAQPSHVAYVKMRGCRGSAELFGLLQKCPPSVRQAIDLVDFDRIEPEVRAEYEYLTGTPVIVTNEAVPTVYRGGAAIRLVASMVPHAPAAGGGGGRAAAAGPAHDPDVGVGLIPTGRGRDRPAAPVAKQEGQIDTSNTLGCKDMPNVVGGDQTSKHARFGAHLWRRQVHMDGCDGHRVNKGAK